MIEGIIYFIVIIFANTVGAISGMGGGVIIKPIFDTLHFHSLAAISFYSSVAVLTMSVVSTVKQLKNGVRINYTIASLISFGSILGGIFGNATFDKLLAIFQSDNYVQLIQIGITCITLVAAFCYTKFKTGHSFHFTQPVWFLGSGVFLGFLSTLLGIGGGPINVALLMACFAFSIKEATVYSIITIFFSQIAKLGTIAQTTGFAQFDLSILYFVIPAAILGGFTGAWISNQISSQRVVLIYQLVIVFVLVLNLWNGVRLFL